MHSSVLTDLNPVIQSTVEPEVIVLAGMTLTFNCTVPEVSNEIVPSIGIIWRSPGGSELGRTNGTRFLVLELRTVQTTDSGNYTCSIELDFSGVSATSSIFNLQVQGTYILVILYHNLQYSLSVCLSVLGRLSHLLVELKIIYHQ